MTEDTCSKKRCDLINQILKGTVYESYYCRTHKRHYYPNKPTDTMINPMTPTEQDKELRRAIVDYRIKCDYYLSDRDEGVISQEEYETAISGELDSAVQLITADRKRVALEARLYDSERTLAHIQNGMPVERLKTVIENRIAELKAQQEEVK